MKKTIALLLVLVMAIFAFAGCSGQNAQPSASPDQESPDAPESAPAEQSEEAAGPVEITVVTSYGGDDGNRGNYETAVAGYEETTGNTVLDASATSNEEWKAKVMADFETGTEPDVLFYFLGPDANPIIEADKVVPLDEIRAEYPDYASNMKEDMLVPSPVDDQVYAVPSTGFWESLFVNTKVLEAAGVEVPGPGYTWDQFLADCQKIKDAGFTPVAVSLQEVPHYWFEFTVFNNGSTASHLDVPASATDATGEKWAAGFEDLKQLYDLGYLPENTLTATDAETVQLMADGEAAFLIDGSWKVGYFVENCADHLSDFAVKYVPGKGDRKATDIIGGISMGYYITRQAWEDETKREAAIKFIEYMTSDEVLSTFVTTEVTALKNGAKSAGLNEIQMSAADMCSEVTSIVGAVQDKLSAEARADLFANVKNIVTEKMTAAEALESALAIQPAE
jgi:raffinose/stachyose/melibiose transport system substrate-binding protein